MRRWVALNGVGVEGDMVRGVAHNRSLPQEQTRRSAFAACTCSAAHSLSKTCLPPLEHCAHYSFWGSTCAGGWASTGSAWTIVAGVAARTMHVPQKGGQAAHMQHAYLVLQGPVLTLVGLHMHRCAGLDGGAGMEVVIVPASGGHHMWSMHN